MMARAASVENARGERNREHQEAATRILLLARDARDRLGWRPVTTVATRGRLDVAMTAWAHDEEPPPGRYRAERDDGASFELDHLGPVERPTERRGGSELSERSQAKAVRLLDGGGVREVTEARTFLVRGDHGTYAVTLAGSTASCSCPAHGSCSHAEAARLAAGAHARRGDPRRAPAAEGRAAGDRVDRVCTGRWHVVRDVPPGTIVPVRISVGAARFVRGSGGFPVIEELVPRGLLDIKDDGEFARRYRERLDEHGVERIQGRLDELHREFPGLPLVLLCFEADRRDCHRGDFASWYEERTGVVVPEFTPADLRRPTVVTR